MTNKMVEYALKYKHSYGLCVIPTDGKVSRVKWTEYQDKMPSDEIIADWWTSKFPGSNIAVITGKVSGYVCVVDVDSYKDTSVMDSIKVLMPDGLRFPISTTPRGGQHFWFRSNEQLGDKIGFLKGVDFRSMGIIIAPPSKGYKWLITPKSTPIPMLPDSIVELLAGSSFNFGKNTNNKPANGKYFDDGTRDVEMFTIANSLVKTGQPQDFAEDVLNRIMLSWGETDPEWSKAKVKSAMKRHSHEGLSDKIKEWVLDSVGTFVGLSMDMELGIMDKLDKQYRSKVLKRLIDAGIIERVGSRNGQFRRINRDIKVINWKSADPFEYYNLKFPLDIGDKVNIKPTNIIIIAGTSNMGKTAMCLKAALMNSDKRVRYINVEMDASELAERISFFGCEKKEWDHVEFCEMEGHGGDIVDPDGLNIIDYLTPPEGEYYKTEALINDIHSRLKAGICIICIQKKPNQLHGYGGSGTVFRSRLYLALDFEMLTFVKIKSPKRDIAGKPYFKDGDEIPFILTANNNFILK